MQVLESTHFDTADLIGHVQIGMDDDSNITSQLPPDRVRDALQAIGGQRALPYYNGPLFVVKDSVVTESTSRTPTKPATSRVHVWAQYESDLFSEMRKTMEENHESTVHHKSQGQSGKHWQCSVCNKFCKKTSKACCGVKRREHLMQQRAVEKLNGCMLGSAAVVALENDEFRARTVLFGPHPELSNQANVQKLLVEALRWCCRVVD